MYIDSLYIYYVVIYTHINLCKRMGDDTNLSVVVTSHGIGKAVQSETAKELCLMMWFYILNWEMRTQIIS